MRTTKEEGDYRIVMCLWAVGIITFAGLAMTMAYVSSEDAGGPLGALNLLPFVPLVIWLILAVGVYVSWNDPALQFALWTLPFAFLIPWVLMFRHDGSYWDDRGYGIEGAEIFGLFLVVFGLVITLASDWWLAQRAKERAEGRVGTGQPVAVPAQSLSADYSLEPAANAPPIMERKRADRSVFIAYRRKGGFPWAKLVWEDLRSHQIDSFMDLENLRSAGYFDSRVFRQINARPYFLLIVTEGSLKRCSSADDWLRQEIEHAVESKRLIVPFIMEGVDLNAEVSTLSNRCQAALKRSNNITVHEDYFNEALTRLRTDRLVAPTGVVLTELSESDHAFARERGLQVSSITNAPPAD